MYYLLRPGNRRTTAGQPPANHWTQLDTIAKLVGSSLAVVGTKDL